MPRTILAALAAVLVALQLAGTAATARADDMADLKAMMGKVLDAWETLDPMKAEPFYDKEDDNVYFDLAPLKYTGWAAYAAGTKDVFTEFASLSLSMNDDVWMERHGNVAIAACTGRCDVAMKNGEKQSFDWRWTTVWETKGQEWRIEHEHLSAPLPMEPASTPKAAPAPGHEGHNH
jgi:ketosteroid isomerase-like protein